MISAKMMASRLRRDRSPGTISGSVRGSDDERAARDGACRARRSASHPRTGPLPVLVAEAVPDAAYREQVLRLLRIRLDLLPQMADVHVDGPRIAVRGVAPHAREQHVAREHPSRRARERGQDLELHVGRLHDVAVARHGALARVDAQTAHVHRALVVGVRARHPRAAERRLHARAELAHRERLGDVVVGAELEPEDLVDLLRLGREHDDRHGLALRPQAPADLQAVHARQHHVQDHEVEDLLGEAGERLAPVGRGNHLVTVPLEWEREQGLDGWLIVHQQDSRGPVCHDQPDERIVTGNLAGTCWTSACTAPPSCRRWSRCSWRPSRWRTGPPPRAPRWPRTRSAAPAPRRRWRSSRGPTRRAPRARPGTRRWPTMSPPRCARPWRAAAGPCSRYAASSPTAARRRARGGWRPSWARAWDCPAGASSSSPTATRSGAPGAPSCPGPPCCWSWPGCSRRASCARRSRSCPRPAPPLGSPAPARGRARRPAARWTR